MYRFFQVLEKDSMESYIKDSSIWFKSMGKSKLNLVFIKEVWKTFIIFKKKKYFTGIFKLNDKQINFLENLFGVNLKICRTRKDFHKILFFMVDFAKKPKSFTKVFNVQLKMIVKKLRLKNL